MYREEMLQTEHFSSLFNFFEFITATLDVLWRAIWTERCCHLEESFSVQVTNKHKHHANPWGAFAHSWHQSIRMALNVYSYFHSCWPILSKLNLTRYSEGQKPFVQPSSHRSILFIFGVAHPITTVKLLHISNFFSW
jgi:hypothetical protein